LVSDDGGLDGSWDLYDGGDAQRRFDRENFVIFEYDRFHRG
jgi:hypothetical protein